jgi:hypothetical protein
MLLLVMWRFTHEHKESSTEKKQYINVHLHLLVLLSGYSRNQTAPMSPRSYSAYTNAYGPSATSYGVPSPVFLNGNFYNLLTNS